MLNCLAARVTRGTEVPSPRARAAAEIVSISLIVRHHRAKGVTARIEEGRVIACHDGLDIEANAWAAATAADWLDTVIEPDAKQVRTGGDRWLTQRLLVELHRALFGI